MRYEIRIGEKPVYFERCKSKWEALARATECFEADGLHVFAITVGDELQAQITRGRERVTLTIRPEKTHRLNARQGKQLAA